MPFINELGPLSDPSRSDFFLDLKGFEKKDFLFFLRTMLRIRLAEERIADFVGNKLAHCPCHLSIGQEAVPTGIALHLKKTDRVFGAHRSHGHYIALGGCVHQLLAEVLGKKTGCSRGMGGSMHIVAKDHGFAGSVPIVSGTVPLAVGAGLAAKMDGGDDVAVAYFGDGACEEGIVHESLNIASVMEIPVIFVVENNLFSSHLDIELRQPSNRVSRFAEANKIDVAVIDGNDVCAVSKIAQSLIENARKHKKPAFIEAVTYRWLGHVGHDSNIDVGLKRKPGDIALWKTRDPIDRLIKSLLSEKVCSHSEIEGIIRLEKEALDQVSEKALSDPYPPLSYVHDFVYKAT